MGELEDVAVAETQVEATLAERVRKPKAIR